MDETEVEPTIRRILVAVDASVHSQAALEAASELADSLKAELVGIFVEDINLLHLAGLPFAREISFLPVSDRPLDSPSMERELRLQAEHVRQLLAAVAGRRQLQWSFRVVRGQVAAELLTAAAGADMLALGRASWATTRRVRLGSTARVVVAQAARSVLLLQHGHAVCQPVQLVYDGSTSARRALRTAIQVALAARGHLTVMLIADTPEQAQHLQEEIAVSLQAPQMQGLYRQLITPTTEELAKAVQAAGGGTLVIGADNPLLEGEGLPTLLDAIDCSVILIR
ncbi:MAG TPA: universal stress protein [Candidatus Tectomicrobia bacterium]|nr:universal stress protein [Candidatus Tectomicrobia bacterium]